MIQARDTDRPSPIGAAGAVPFRPRLASKTTEATRAGLGAAHSCHLVLTRVFGDGVVPDSRGATGWHEYRPMPCSAAPEANDLSLTNTRPGSAWQRPAAGRRPEPHVGLAVGDDGG